MASDFDIVTGAFGYTGRHIARALLERGRRVRTLTAHPQPSDPLAGKIETAPFDFDRPAELVKTLAGIDTVYSTYWVRFNYREMTFDHAVANIRTLIDAAKTARVRRFVHISIANASPDSLLPYFRGKGTAERALMESGLSYAIIRPTIVFGHDDILINNLAWLLRRFPLFAIPGRGDYRLQPIFVEDLARFATDAAAKSENLTLDAGGPNVFTFNQLVRLIADAIGSRAAIVHVPDGFALLLARIIGWMTGDVTLTRDEIRGLAAGLLVAGGPPAGATMIGQWLSEHAASVGAAYASELARRSG
ncbi:MAG: SDR family oxidoreductase [Candidatus Binataceae bacterium]